MSKITRIKNLKNHLYFAVWCVWCLVFFPIITMVGLVLSGPSKRIFYRFIRIWAGGIMFFTGTRINVYGREYIRKNKHYLFLSNHQAFIDIPILVLALSPHNFVFLSKKILFYLPFIGWAMLRAGYISINRNSQKGSYVAIQKIIKKIKKGQSALIFPEGTYFPPHSPGKYKKGFVKVLRETGVNAIPITIVGSYELFKEMKIYPKKIDVVIGKNIPYNDIKNKTKSEMTFFFREIITGNYRKCME